MRGGPLHRLVYWFDAALAAVGSLFIHCWTVVERGYRRPASRIALGLKFAFYPLLALGAVAWLGWDWTHSRFLNSAEDAIFDQVVQWRPLEPKPSGRVVVVEIDECSIEYFRAQGEGGWPWSRQRHADLLDQLDRAGANVVGYDVLFPDVSQEDPDGDRSLDAMAEGGAGRFIFASTRLHPDYDVDSTLHVSEAPAAFAVVPDPGPDPTVALLLPFGDAMSRFSAIVNVSRSEDGVIRDFPLRATFGEWALPSVPLRLAATYLQQPLESFPATVRPNWRQETRVPHVSAANLLTGDNSICVDEVRGDPDLNGRAVLVGYSASGLGDTKPTPVDPVMPGVEVMAEAVEALVAGSAIRSPPAWLKYVLAGLLAVLTTLAFFRGEPATDIDSIFLATNLTLLAVAFVGMTFFGYFFDIFASIGFVSLVFGFCRMYAAAQRGRAVGNGDYRPELDPASDRWLLIARLRFVPSVGLDAAASSRQGREFNRRLRRFLYAGSDAVMLEGVVERKSWLHDSLQGLTVLVWHGESESGACESARGDLTRLEHYLAGLQARQPVDGSVCLVFACRELDEGAVVTDRGLGLRLSQLVGQVLASSVERPLAPSEIATIHVGSATGVQ